MAEHRIIGKLWTKKQTEEKKLSPKSVFICSSTNNNKKEPALPTWICSPTSHPSWVHLPSLSPSRFNVTCFRCLRTAEVKGGGAMAAAVAVDRRTRTHGGWMPLPFALVKRAGFFGGRWNRSWEIAWVTLKPAPGLKKTRSFLNSSYIITSCLKSHHHWC